MSAPPPTNRIYGASMGWKLFALGLCGFSAFFLCGSLYELHIGASSPSVVAAGFAFFVAGMAFAVYTFRVSIRFTGDAIEHRTLMGIRRLPLAEIRGLKEFVSRDEKGSTRYLRLVPDDDRIPAMDFAKNYSFDDSFHQWFYGLRDLDAEEKQTHKGSNFGLV